MGRNKELATYLKVSSQSHPAPGMSTIIYIYYLSHCGVQPTCLESVQNNTFTVANFLIYQKFLDICPLVPTQLDDFSHFQVFLHCSVAAEILLESLANSLDIQVLGQASNSCDTFSTVSLLNTDVDLFL